jgi:hypothetical protein
MNRAWSAPKTALSVFFLGVAIGLIGDAGHVASGTTRYTWPGVPRIGLSAAWFPVLVGSAVLATAALGRRLDLPRRTRTRRDAWIGASAVLVLYVLTALLRALPGWLGVMLTGAAAVALWRWWDASRTTGLVALAAALLGPATEIALVRLGAVRWAADASALFGVASWLPCLYFAAGAVGSGLWRALSPARPEAAAATRG